MITIVFKDMSRRKRDVFISSTELQRYKLGYFNCCICSYFRRILHDLHETSEERTEESSGNDQRDGDVIVEFGSNKNCRIPMQKAAIAQVEKASAE